MAPYMYKFIPENWQSEGTDSTGYPPWLYGLEKIYLLLTKKLGSISRSFKIVK